MREINSNEMPDIDERILPIIKRTIQFYEWCISTGCADEWLSWMRSSCRKYEFTEDLKGETMYREMPLEWLFADT